MGKGLLTKAGAMVGSGRHNRNKRSSAAATCGASLQRRGGSQQREAVRTQGGRWRLGPTRQGGRVGLELLPVPTQQRPLPTGGSEKAGSARPQPPVGRSRLPLGGHRTRNKPSARSHVPARAGSAVQRQRRARRGAPRAPVDSLQAGDLNGSMSRPSWSPPLVPFPCSVRRPAAVNGREARDGTGCAYSPS